MSIIHFQKPQYLFYILSISFINSIKTYLRWYKSEYLKRDAFNRAILSYLSYFLVIIFYIFQKMRIEKIKKKANYYYNDYEKKNSIIQKRTCWFFFIIFICFLSMTLGELKYKYNFYNYEMKKFHKPDIENLELFFLFVSYYITEHYFLNIKFYIHHKIAIFFMTISICILLLISLIYDSIKNHYSFKSLIFIILIISQSQFLRTIPLVIAKKLNFEHFINMNLILSLIGCYGILFSFIFYVFFILSKHISFFFIFKNINIFNSSFSDFLILIFYIILSSIIHILIFKVIEETRPSYILMTKSFSYLISNLFKLFYEKGEIIELSDWKCISISIIFLFCFCVFSEIITLNFCELNKYTRESISIRGQIITKEDMATSDVEINFPYTKQE